MVREGFHAATGSTVQLALAASTHIPPSTSPTPSFRSAISRRPSAHGCKCRWHSSTALRSRAMHPPPPSQGPPSEGRDWRGQAMEETMLWTISELMHLTRVELCDLADRIAIELPELEAGTAERSDALAKSRQYPAGDGLAGSSSVTGVTKEVLMEHLPSRLPAHRWSRRYDRPCSLRRYKPRLAREPRSADHVRCPGQNGHDTRQARSG